MTPAQTMFFNIFCLILIHSFSECNRVLSRKKRYLVFPEGTTLSVSACMTVQTGITPGEIFTNSINWGLSYNLPNDTQKVRDYIKKTKQSLKRRHRRELYNKLERILHSMGYNGRNCIMRTLCEASLYFGQKKGEHLWEEILRIIFRYPVGREFWPNRDHDDYNLAANTKEGTCYEKFSCPFSLIDLAQGYYSFT